MEHQQPTQRRSAEDQENEPLPPIPDGGLAQAMPDWLRDDPPAPSPPIVGGDTLGFITADDLPVWLRHLSPDGETPVPPRPETPIARAAVQPGLASPIPPPPDIPTPAPSSNPPAPVRAPATTSTPPRLAEPQPRDRRALVGVIGFIVLALGVLAYLYARGVL